MEVYACGNNAWRQLEFPAEGRISWPSIAEQRRLEAQLQNITEEPEDFHQFRKVLSIKVEERVLGIWAGLSWTVIKTSSYIYCAGQFGQELPILENFDLNLVGILGTGTVQSSEDFLSLVTQSPNHSQSDLKVQQLVANQACWTVLCSDGSVWTWGDARFPGCLGREVDDENSSSIPTVIPNLFSSNISSAVTKIVSGGYITAALTSTHDVYIWGSSNPSSSHPIIPNLSGDPTPLIIADPENPSCEFDFMDIAIGAKHMIALTTNQRMVVIGNNANGQLGLSDEHAEVAPFAQRWKEVRMPSPVSKSLASKETSDMALDGNRRRVVGVAAGANISFILMKE